jgi:hypothetical protein
MPVMDRSRVLDEAGVRHEFLSHARFPPSVTVHLSSESPAACGGHDDFRSNRLTL